MTQALQFACAISVATAAFALAVASSGGSLWLDELHTAWAALGPWQEIATRAAAGNQTPTYFCLVAVVLRATQSIVSIEFGLRMTSVVAWLACLGVVAACVRVGMRSNNPGTATGEVRRFDGDQPFVPTWVAISLLVVDRIQWFYASEARPYALVQLASLLGWLCLLLCINAAARCDQRNYYRAACCWLLSAGFAVHLHLTALIPIAWQCAMGCMLLPAQWNLPRWNPAQWNSGTAESASHQGPRWLTPRFGWLMMTALLILLSLPLISLAFPVWDRRSQWSSFANDTSLSNTVGQFPVIALGFPVLIFAAVQWTARFAGVDARIFGRKLEHKSHEQSQWRFDRQLTVWYVAVLGPWLSAWLLTQAGIAPLMHRRFLIACAAPLVIATVITATRLRSQTIRWICYGAVVIGLLYSQGTLDLWRSGQIVGRMRFEDWHSMTPALEQMQLAGEPVFLVSGLIEANQLPEPIPTPLSGYLKFPLDGTYTRSEQLLASVVPLENNEQRWNSRILPVLSQLDSDTHRAWLVYRGSLERLEVKLRILTPGLKSAGWEWESDTSAVKHYGNLHIAQLRRAVP